MDAYFLQLLTADGWRVFRPIFEGRNAALRQFKLAIVAMPTEDIRLIDSSGTMVVANSMLSRRRADEPRPTQAKGKA